MLCHPVMVEQKRPRGRPRQFDEKMHVRMPGPLLLRLTHYAKARDMDVSEAIREAIRRLVGERRDK